MPSILTDDDKQTVKRTVPKSSNKIHAVAVARLYIAYPNRSQWTDTGLQGAAVLANDLVGNTFWIKLVDISSSNRGVIWDQEIYDSFSYNQDRTFFHTFELEQCLAGLSFSDEKEAKQFLKKMNEREKSAHKNTRSKPFALGPAQTGYGGGQQTQTIGGGGKHRFGISSLLGRDRSNSGATQQPAQSIIPPRGVEINHHAPPSPIHSRATAEDEIDLSDPAVQAVLDDLLAMGITEDQIQEHKGFIKSYLEQNKATQSAEQEKKERASRAPPPPPPVAANLSPQNTGGSASKRGAPPAPPPSRRAGGIPAAPPVQEPPSPSPSPPRAPSPPRPRFRAPPPIADAGKFANEKKPAPPARNSPRSAGPPPPLPPKTPLDDETPTPSPQTSRFNVPPAFEGKRVSSGPPPPPSRNSGPPLPPPRDSTPAASMPPPPPPRGIPPPLAASSGPPLPPPLPPSANRPVPPAPMPPPMPNFSSGGPPPPPPLPPSAAPPGGGPPPPPPLPPGGAPGIGADTAAAAAPSAPQPGRGGLLADIRGGAKLKKVSDQEKRDRSGAMVPGGEAAAPPPAGGSSGGDAAAGGGLAGALASALAARKSKVGGSDDEKDDDDW
ncbi:WH1-domain-containing protein [Polychaeton citri CBS 116435]|uniref:WH1-domain-containing protein n=1 Tax=Polychaeton citri CBS 116435 TaxID=1314669 RepID=A0A9P4Q7R1_9PEZI|nr:WH1-domain-containing protein [Polychaeton citri CBS 116435]